MNQSFGGFTVVHEVSVGDILSRSYYLLGLNPVVYLGLPLISILPVMIAGARLTYLGDWAMIFGAAMLSLLLGLCLQGAVAYAVYMGLRGERAGFWESLSRGLTRVLSILGAAILTGFAFNGCFLVLTAAFMTGNGAVMVIGFLAFLFLVALLWCMLSVTIPVCVVEKKGPMASMNRSSELTKGYRLKIFALGLIMVIGFGIFNGLVAFLLGLVIDSYMISHVIGSILGVLPISFIAVALAVTYYELLAAKEGLTLDKLAGIFD